MSEPQLEQLPVGDRRCSARDRRARRGPARRPGIFWLGGFRSDMQGSKAQALDHWAAEQGRALTRFDYSGHGAPGGRFEDGTISRWLEEAEAVFDAFTVGPAGAGRLVDGRLAGAASRQAPCASAATTTGCTAWCSSRPPST